MADDPYSDFFLGKGTSAPKEKTPSSAPKIIEPPQGRVPDPYSGFYSTVPEVKTAAKKTAADYSAMPWGEVLSKGGEEFFPSAGRALKAIPSAIYNYPETIEAIKKAGVGKIVESVIEPYKAIGKAVMPTSLGGDSGELKKMIAEDPYSVLSAVPVGGALGAVGKGLGAAGTIGKIGGAPLRAAGYITSKASDPLGTMLGVGSGIAGLGPAAYRKARAVGAGIEDYPFEMAYKAGAMPSGSAEKSAFNQFASGQGNASEFAIKAQNAARAIRDKELSDWAKSKGVTTSAFTQPLPYTLVHQAINDYRNTRLPPRQFGMDSANAAHDALDKIERNILTRQLPQNAAHPVNTLSGFDQLKQELWDASEAAGSDMERNAILAAHRGVKDTLMTAAPEYEDLMSRWRAINTNIQNINKTLGTTDKVAANAALAKFVKQQKTPEGRDLISKLAEHEPELPYMAAGSVLHHDTARGGAGIGQTIALSQYGPQILSSLASGRPLEAAKGLGAAALNVGMQSPSLAKDISYTAGQLSQVPPVPLIAAATKVGKAAYPYAYPAAYQIEKMKEEQPEPAFSPSHPIEVSRATGGRAPRATGGRIGMTAERLLSMLEGAKRSVQKDTEALLQEPDEKIAKALTIAKEGI